MLTSEEIEEKLKKWNASDLADKWEIEALTEDNILSEDEELIRIAKGTCKNKEGIVVATNQRIFFFKMSLTQTHLEELMYNQITSVNHNNGLVYASLIIHTGGNKIVINDMYQTDVLPFTEYIRKQITGDTKENETVEAKKEQLTSSNDTITQLERLAKLKEQGILTDEEFAIQKAKILNNG